ncbi:hypothetical protein ACFLRX_05885 [Acidobacteriota bacterium]
MTKLKKILGIAVLIIIGVVNISIYWNIHLYNKTKKTGNYEEKIKILERSNRFFPFNNMVYSELGRSYLDLAFLDFMNVEHREYNLEKSIKSFVRSIKLNPGYYQSHFYFAQALSYQQYFFPIDVNFYDEYKKAARLTTFDTQAYFEVGRFLFSRWNELSEEDKSYTLGLLKNLRANGENLQTIMQIWAINGGDFSVMKDILPEESEAYRVFSRFIADRRLSINERHKNMAQAEYLDYINAKNTLTDGERQVQLQNTEQAINLFLRSIKTIENVRFYQNLTGKTLIDISEYFDYKRTLYLNLTERLIIKYGDLEEAEPYLRKYLDMQTSAAEIGDLEILLKDKNLLRAEPETYINDLFPYYVKVLIDYKLNRYRDIIEGGKNLKDRFNSPPESIRKDLARVCQMIGDSYQKLDFLYDAEEFFNLAITLDPTYLDPLKGMSQNFMKLNKPDLADGIERKIKRLLTPEVLNFENLTIQRGQSFIQPLFLREKKIGIMLIFDDFLPGQSPLLTVEYNDQIIWEDYLETPSLSLTVNSEEGRNGLKIFPTLRNVSLKKIVYSSDNEVI